MKCALLQINPTVGDLEANAARIVGQVRAAAAQRAVLGLTPELALTGYPPRDLLLYPAFAAEAERVTRELAQAIAPLGLALILGTIGRNLSGRGRPLYNQAVFINDGQVRAVYHKRLLSAGDAFDETRYFEPGTEPGLIEFQGRRLALTIGQDLWNEAADPLENHPPFEVLINMAASPFIVGQQPRRQERVSGLARRHQAQVLYVNAVGGNDDLIFDGRSLQASPEGTLLGRARPFAEDLLVADLDNPSVNLAPDDFLPEAETWAALGLGLRDYVRKTGFDSVILGLSGGLDSALAAALAVEALGADKVHGLLLPSPYSSGHSLADAAELAKNLGLSTATVAIEPIMKAYDQALAASFAGRGADLTEENLQARIRGDLLMAFSNKFGYLLLTTGNKSEISVGYCTLYGDMCGALAVIGDLYKTEAFSLGRWFNERRNGLIPERILTKPPSAELRPDQTDQDSLPPYDELDGILKALLEERLTAADLAARGHDEATVKKVADLVGKAEFKRRQAAPVLKITGPALNGGRGLPIAGRPAYDRPAAGSQTAPGAKGLAEAPYLSVVTVSRNDDHGGDPLRRTQLFINSLAWQAKHYQLQTELVVADWNPPAEKEPLAAAMHFPVNDYFTGRVVVVPPEVHAGYRHGDRLPLFQMIGKNVGIRRARGEFILATNIDILLDDSLFAEIARKRLDPNRMYRADRYDVVNTLPDEDHAAQQAFCRETAHQVRRNHRMSPPEYAELLEKEPRGSTALLAAAGQFPWAVFETKSEPPLVEARADAPWEYLNTMACGDFTLMHRDAWDDLGGYGEFEAYSMHIDSIGCVNAHFAGYREICFLPPLVCYHIEHAPGSGWTPTASASLYDRICGAGIPFLHWTALSDHLLPLLRKQPSLRLNDGRWGLDGFELEEYDYSETDGFRHWPKRPFPEGRLMLSALNQRYESGALLQDMTIVRETAEIGLTYDNFKNMAKSPLWPLFRCGLATYGRTRNGLRRLTRLFK